MRVPFVSRARFDEMRELKQFIIDYQAKQIEELKNEAHKLHDAIYLKNCGFQLFDTLPGLPSIAPAEPELTPEQQKEQTDMTEEARDMADLNTTARVRPSQLGNKLMSILQRRTLRRVDAAHPAAKIFAEAKAEVEAKPLKVVNK